MTVRPKVMVTDSVTALQSCGTWARPTSAISTLANKFFLLWPVVLWPVPTLARSPNWDQFAFFGVKFGQFHKKFHGKGWVLRKTVWAVSGWSGARVWVSMLEWPSVQGGPGSVQAASQPRVGSAQEEGQTFHNCVFFSRPKCCSSFLFLGSSQAMNHP